MAGQSSLSSVVSNLIRASMGSSVDTNVADEDLDRHVAELILKEAKQKEEKYLGRDGIRAYRPEPEMLVPKPNKRFLSTIIRSVDDHNASVIHSQAKAASDAREEIEEKERRLRRARADEAAKDRVRRLMAVGERRPSARDSQSGRRRHEDEDNMRSGSSKTDGQDRRHDVHEAVPSSSRRHADEGTNSPTHSGSDKSRRRSPGEHVEPRHREDAGRDRHTSTHRSSHSSRRDPSRVRAGTDTTSRDAEDTGKSRSHRHKGGASEEDIDKTRARRDRSRDHRKKESRRYSRSRSRSTSPSRSKDNSASSSRHSKHSSPRRRHRSVDAEPSEPTTSSRHAHPLSKSTLAAPEQSRSRSPSPSRHTAPIPPIPSKMDRYFESAYDPALDNYPAANLTLNDPVPESAFDHWNNMLELMKMRKEDKADRKRKEKEEKRKEKKRKKGDESDEDREEEDERNRRIRLGLEKPGVMDMKYAKRGAIREWDVGKQVT